MKNLLLVLSLVITASPAFASRARLESLGEGKNGSYYINDGRNIFLNPASINNYKKKLFLELGTASANVDASDASKVQGGFTNTFGDFTYGLYLGRESDRALESVSSTNTAFGKSFVAPDHAFDFFFGGAANELKYGVDVFYAGALSQTTSVAKNTASMFGVKLGVDVNNLAVFTTVGISSSSKAATGTAANDQEIKGKISIDAGVTYTMDDMTLLGKFSTFGTELDPGSAIDSGKIAEIKNMAFGLGAGWKKEASKSVTMYTRVQFDYQKRNTETTNTVLAGAAPAGTFGAESWYNVPVVLGAEAAATSWLTVRGSISHSLIGQHQKGQAKDSLNNMTTAAMGLGFNFGDLTIDALVGQSATVAGMPSESSQGNSQAGAATGNVLGLGDKMLSRVSMTYNF